MRLWNRTFSWLRRLFKPKPVTVQEWWNGVVPVHGADGEVEGVSGPYYFRAKDGKTGEVLWPKEAPWSEPVDCSDLTDQRSLPKPEEKG
jgi:hypothetical protein